ncbi:MAG: N-acetylmuramoyl-L-alanine amidase [Chthoniobacterales bacterium]
MRIVDYPLSKGQWYSERQQKKFIVWHGTQGRTACTPSNGRPGVATSSIDGWNADEKHIGTPFLVDRDGTIYRTYKDEREWIFHLGLAETKGRYDKASIGIEFANELELIPANGKFYAFDRIHKNTEYVGPRLQRTWRVHDWWAQFETAQVDAAIELTVDLCRRHGIPKTFYYPSTTYDFPHCFEVAGVLCHSNCRKDKTDLLLEDWVWAKLRAAGFELVGETPCLPVELAVAAATKVVSVAAALTKSKKGSHRPPPLGKAKVQSPDGSLNVRSAPRATSRKLRTLKNGKVVKVFGLNGGWACISATGKSWVVRRYLEPVESAGTVEVTLSLLAPTVDHQVTQVDVLEEVFYSETAKKQLRRDVPLYQLTDRAGFFHKGSLQVDVDGSPRAYSPRDASPLRLDALANANPDSLKYIQGKGQGRGPRPGFYVSTTALLLSGKRPWDCDNYLDAEAIPYFVHPPARNGVKLGDVGIIVHVPSLKSDSPKWTAAIHGDCNNARRVSEVSLRVAVNLWRSRIDPKTLKVTGLSANNGDDARNYFYVYFPGSSLKPAASAPYWPESAIKAKAEPLFAAWGGLERVQKCLQHI